MVTVFPHLDHADHVKLGVQVQQHHMATLVPTVSLRLRPAAKQQAAHTDLRNRCTAKEGNAKQHVRRLAWVGKAGQQGQHVGHRMLCMLCVVCWRLSVVACALCLQP